jgi:2-methylaconitate cis-trans-isomerase PrpF
MHIPASLLRGGTSKCWLFRQVHVPADRNRLERLLVDAYGAADPVQLDGVGGATPTTSKAAVVGVSARGDLDIDYLFAQVGIGTGTVEWGSNCGNCATAVALYAVAKGLVPVTGDRTRVVMRNINTGTVLEAVVDTTGGVVHEFGAQTVPGTRSGGVAVGLTFMDPIGRTTGALLPSGAAVESLELGNGGGSLHVSMLDAGAPVVLVDAARASRTGAEAMTDVHADVPWLRAVRHAAARRMGMLEDGEEPGDAVPKVGLVGPPIPYNSTLDESIAADDYDVSVRMLSMNAPHPAIGLTSAVAVAVANSVEGSVVLASSAAPRRPTLRIGTPAGVIRVECADPGEDGPRRVTVQRAARILCDAAIFVPDPRPAAA